MEAFHTNGSTKPTMHEQVPLVSTWEPRAKARRKKARRGRAQFVGNERRAVLAALTAAKLYQAEACSLQEAAHAIGTTNVSYVRAALTLLQAEAYDVVERVLAGQESLLAATAGLKKLAKTLTAYREIDKYFDLRREFLDKTRLYADLASHLKGQLAAHAR
jgi:hypothetical protein